jgi:hypothetical protein
LGQSTGGFGPQNYSQVKQWMFHPSINPSHQAVEIPPLSQPPVLAQATRLSVTILVLGNAKCFNPRVGGLDFPLSQLSIALLCLSPATQHELLLKGLVSKPRRAPGVGMLWPGKGNSSVVGGHSTVESAHGDASNFKSEYWRNMTHT